MRLPAAIEINEHDLKVVLARSFAKQQVSDCIVQRIEGLTDAQISKAIADIFRKEKIKPKPLLVCIPRSLVTIRNLYLPSHDEAEIQQMLQLHISRIVPYQKEEVVYDYALLGVDAMNSTELILAIAHRDILKKHMNIVQGADLYIDTMSLSSCAVWERVMFAQKAETNISELYLILDADVSSTDFIICSHDHLLFTRGMTLDIEKCVRENQIMRLTGEVRQSLALFHSEETRKNPSKIFLSGAPAIQQLEQVFKQEFEIPVQYVPGDLSLRSPKWPWPKTPSGLRSRCRSCRSPKLFVIGRKTSPSWAVSPSISSPSSCCFSWGCRSASRRTFSGSASTTRRSTTASGACWTSTIEPN